MSHYIILREAPAFDEAPDFLKEIEDDLEQEGLKATVFTQLDRTIVWATTDQDIDAIRTALEDIGLTVEDSWTSAGPSGHKLEVTLFYHDEKQVVSASIDEGELLEALKGIETDDARETRKLYAITALAYDNEFSDGYGLFDGSMEIQLLDIMQPVEHWYDHEELQHYVSPAVNPPMAEFTFWPCATLPSGEIVDIVLPGVETSFSIPAQNLRPSLDPSDEADRKHILAQRGVPRNIVALAEMLPYRLSFNNPEVLFSHTPQTMDV